jgi:hypothetical protein
MIPTSAAFRKEEQNILKQKRRQITRAKLFNELKDQISEYRSSSNATPKKPREFVGSSSFEIGVSSGGYTRDHVKPMMNFLDKKTILSIDEKNIKSNLMRAQFDGRMTFTKRKKNIKEYSQIKGFSATKSPV